MRYEVSATEATMPLALRRAAAADAPVIVEFNRLLAKETEGKTLDPAVLTPGVQAGLADPHKGLYFVAEDEGAVVGQVMVTYEWSDWRNGWIWWIQSVYIREAHRGRGVFRALYEHVHQRAAADPTVIGLRLYVEEHNHRAQEVYRRLGMEKAGYFVLERCPL
jgi:ribosomal protein S18 acetylase RimI-like enzyme